MLASYQRWTCGRVIKVPIRKKDHARYEAKHNPGIVYEWDGYGRVLSRVDSMNDLQGDPLSRWELSIKMISFDLDFSIDVIYDYALACAV